MKKYFTLFLFILLNVAGKGQTNVSGGIYTNTTWTKANSPYIVTGNVVVFPGYTLTIEPGVTVKFADSQLLEIRQAKLIAVGTSTDSITFTSNSLSPYPGIYAGIHAAYGYGSKMSYCNIHYAADAFCGDMVSHSTAMYNIIGIGAQNLIDSCISMYNTGYGAFAHDITNSNVSKNQVGIYQSFNIINCIIDSNIEEDPYESIDNCKIRHDSVGIYQGGVSTTISNCLIANNYFGVIIATFTTINNCTIDSNYIGIENGKYGFIINGLGGPETVSNCQISHNSVGISLVSD